MITPAADRRRKRHGLARTLACSVIAVARTRGRAKDGVLSLPLPPFKDDLVAILR